MGKQIGSSTIYHPQRRPNSHGSRSQGQRYFLDWDHLRTRSRDLFRYQRDVPRRSSRLTIPEVLLAFLVGRLAIRSLASEG